jgi:flagellar basal body rod protein FlgF
MSGVQTQVGTGNGTRAGRPAIKAKNKRTRRTKAQIAAAAALPAAPATGPVVRVAKDGTIAAMQQIDGILDRLSVPQLAAIDAWYRAKRPLAA